jgi:hypothetical protein
MSDHESTSRRDLGSCETSGPTPVGDLEGAAFASPLPSASSSGWPIFSDHGRARKPAKDA